MNRFTISQLEQFSGIRSHTIRIWEQRYNALTPQRTEGNVRFYDDSQLRRLLNIVSLMDSGFKVGELCLMTDTELFNILKAKTGTSIHVTESNRYFINQLISAGMAYNELHFEKILASCILKMGLRDAYINVIYPMLIQVGLLWACDSLPPAQEHFITNIIRQKLFTAIDGLPPPEKNAKSWLLFLPENEFHETGLLMSNYLLKQAGYKVTYLGSNVPLDTLKSAAGDISPTFLMFFMVNNTTAENAQEYLNELKSSFGKTLIFLSGKQSLLGELKTGQRVHTISSVQELERLIHNEC